MHGHLAVPASSGVATTSWSSVSGTLVQDTSSDAHLVSFPELEGQEPPQQLESLKTRLEKENRIKEGAENLLNSMHLADPSLRQQVQAELDIANNTIQAITNKKLDIQASLSRDKHTNGTNERKVGGHISNRSETDDRDDFRSALQQATQSISALTALTRPSPNNSSEWSPSTSSDEINRQYIQAMSKLATALQRHVRVRYELELPDVVQAVLPALADKRSKQCRAIAYRVIRYALIDADSVIKLGEQSLDWYIVRSLVRDNKCAVEKEQVIKLIRTIVELGATRKDIVSSGPGVGHVPISTAIMRAFVAVAEHADDPFRLICLQTLAEILLIDIDLVARTGGIRLLLQCLGDGPPELIPILATAFLHIADSPRTRAYLTTGSDLEMVLLPVTDAYGKGPDHAERMRSCTKVIQSILRSWSGLMYFCMNDLRALRTIIDTLRIPSFENREIVLGMFFELFNIRTTSWYQTFIDGRRLTMYRKASDMPRIEHEFGERSRPTFKLTDQYVGLLILVFTNAGLLDALTSMLGEETTASNLSRKATLLMAEILQIANRVLPLSSAARIQAMPEIFAMASNYSDGEQRIVGTTAMSSIDSLNRNRLRLEPEIVKDTFRARANSVEDAVRRGQRQVEQVKLKMGMQMDDKTFQSSLLDSQVMVTKEYSKWNFDTLQELIEGPLLNPKRMEEAIKGARFIRRLMSFFHPFSHRFSDMQKIKPNLKWVRLGCSLLTTLMASPDGVRYLSTEDHFLIQVVKSFAQLDPFNGVPDQDPIFSKKRVQETLTYGYLEMLGTLSKHKEGIELLEKFKVFTAFYHLSELKSREDLIKLIVENLDYNIDGHPRIVLSKALTSSYKHIRLYATRHLGDLIRDSATANAWTLRLLLTQLYDPAPEVCEMAVHFLEEACESKDILQLVVEMRPTLDHLGEVGNSLLLKFVSTPMGFRYLFDAGYIDREMDLWFNERNLYYLVQVEVLLAKVFSSLGSDSEEEEALAFEGSVPPHFYGEMSKTDLGCQVLQDKGHFAEFAQFIRQHGNESADAEIIMKLKSILWAVGNIGATDGGLPFLEEEEIIPAVLEIADQSPIPSLRGTCFFVLGLISSTSQGAEMLDDYQWEATLTPLGLPTGLCIPVDLEKFISLPVWSPCSPERQDNRLIIPTSELELEVLTALQNLANSVIANAASRSLARMRSRPEYRPIFSSKSMFYRALHIISTQRYRLPVRRYVIDLFNVELDADVVAELNKYAVSLKAHPDYKPSTQEIRRMSMFPARSPESDDEVEDVDVPVPRRVPIGGDTKSLRPVSRIVGFEL